MAINNVPQDTSSPEINNMRSLIEQRAEWMYLMNEEAAKLGYETEEFTRKAIFRCGCFRGSEMISSFKDKGDLVELGEAYMNNPNSRVFEKEYIEMSPERLEMHFHYCPLVAGWQKMTDDEEVIAKCCDIAMEGDRGVFSCVPDSEFLLESTLANGDPVCTLIIQKKKD